MIIPGSEDARVAVVTGAASGVGAAAGARLRAAGWFVAGLDIASSDTDLPLETDVSDAAAVSGAVERVVERSGRIDALITCAGVFPPEIAPAHRVDADAWDRVLAINLTGSFNAAKACLSALCESRGAIVFIASGATRFPTPGTAAYVASKAGVLGLMRSIALDYAPLGVRANAISPGWIDTPMAAPALARDDRREAIERRIPAGEVATPDDIAAIAEFLLSPQTRAVTGTEVSADGGLGLTANLGEGQLERFWERVGACI